MDREYYEKLAFDMAKHAYKTVPLYYRLAEKNKIDINNICFEQLPIVDKKTYIESGMVCLSSKYISDYLANKLIWTRRAIYIYGVSFGMKLNNLRAYGASNGCVNDGLEQISTDVYRVNRNHQEPSKYIFANEDDFMQYRYYIC